MKLKISDRQHKMYLKFTIQDLYLHILVKKLCKLIIHRR